MSQKFPLESARTANWRRGLGARSPSASLLALNDPKLDPLVTAYCQQFGVGSRVASFLVLENEADYKRSTSKRSAARRSTATWARSSKAVAATSANRRSRPGKRSSLPRPHRAARQADAGTARRPRQASCWHCWRTSDFELPPSADRTAQLVRQEATCRPDYLAEREQGPRATSASI